MSEEKLDQLLEGMNELRLITRALVDGRTKQMQSWML